MAYLVAFSYEYQQVVYCCCTLLGTAYKTLDNCLSSMHFIASFGEIWVQVGRHYFSLLFLCEACNWPSIANFGDPNSFVQCFRLLCEEWRSTDSGCYVPVNDCTHAYFSLYLYEGGWRGRIVRLGEVYDTQFICMEKRPFSIRLCLILSMLI